jgi:hypothetical protein
MLSSDGSESDRVVQNAIITIRARSAFPASTPAFERRELLLERIFTSLMRANVGALDLTAEVTEIIDVTLTDEETNEY